MELFCYHLIIDSRCTGTCYSYLHYLMSDCLMYRYMVIYIFQWHIVYLQQQCTVPRILHLGFLWQSHTAINHCVSVQPFPYYFSAWVLLSFKTHFTASPTIFFYSLRRAIPFPFCGYCGELWTFLYHGDSKDFFSPNFSIEVLSKFSQYAPQ